MEPASTRPPWAIPKLHLLVREGGRGPRSPGPPSSPTVSAVPVPSHRQMPQSPCGRRYDPYPPPLSALERVPTGRLYGASVTYMDSPPTSARPLRKPQRPGPPLTTTTPTSRGSNNHDSTFTPSAPPGSAPQQQQHPNQRGGLTEDEFMVLHPSLDLTDENGDLSRLLLDKWSVDRGEEAFASVSLFCEMKLSEARRMTSWIESPNRFLTTVCCQLLDKYLQRQEETQQSLPLGRDGGGGHGHGLAFLRKIHDELINAIFIRPPEAPELHYEERLPYFLEFKKLKKRAEAVMAAVENKERTAATKEQLPHKIDKVLATHQDKSNRRLLAFLFRAWANTTRTENEIRLLKCKAFRASRKLNMSSLFRAWRIEALRRAYQRESVEYQTMLSVTAASLSRKDVQIAEQETKLASMSKIIDSLTESNAQLLYRVEQLEAIAAGKGAAAAMGSGPGGAGGSGAMLSFHRRPEATFEQIDTLINQSDEKMDRTNRMLLETMFGMARMVESCAIQMSKDIMDSLEQQLDGSLLQQLSEMVHAENIVKIKAEEARYAPTTPGTPGALHRRVSDGIAHHGSLAAPPGSTLAASLSKGAVAIKDLAQMPIDAFLLNWFRMNLHLSGAVEKASDRTIMNFTTDLVDGRRYSFLLHRLFPTWFDPTMVHEIDVDERLKNIATFHSRVQPELPQVVSSDSIHSASATENVAFVAMLFGSSVNAIRRINLERQRGQFLNIITSWKRVRSLMLEVKRMNDNYDALMVSHLLKEMRTCETLFKQLNSELCAMAIASNESASTFSQIAYKILHLTWRCLYARANDQVSSLELIDERLVERVKDFTHVEIGTVRQLLIRDSQLEFRALTSPGTKGAAATPSVMVMPSSAAPTIPEKEVIVRTEAIRSVVQLYCKDLHDIFKHYSASSGAGSIASLSLSEFDKFIKDCAVCDKTITPPLIEVIYKASLFYSPLTPRDFAAIALTAAVSQASSSGAGGRPEPSSTSFGAADGSSIPDNLLVAVQFGEREMVGLEFVDALLRIAAIKYTTMPLEERFRELMEQIILPNALRSQSEIFRAEVASPKVRAVFQKHKQTLQRIFRYYTSMHALREQQSTMDLKEFAIFAKDCKLIGSFVTEHTLKQVLVNLQRDESGPDVDFRIDFADFQEAIAALTEYVICNPYVPLYKRIEQFINENLLPRARQKAKGAGE